MRGFEDERVADQFARPPCDRHGNVAIRHHLFRQCVDALNTSPALLSLMLLKRLLKTGKSRLKSFSQTSLIEALNSVLERLTHKSSIVTLLRDWLICKYLRRKHCSSCQRYSSIVMPT
jgi:hypothetical protein